MKCPSCEEPMKIVKAGEVHDGPCHQCSGCGYEEVRGTETKKVDLFSSVCRAHEIEFDGNECPMCKKERKL